MEDLKIDSKWLEEVKKVWDLQMELFGFVCRVVTENRIERFDYWGEIAKVETTEQAREFLAKHDFLEKYNNYKKEQKQ